MNFPVPWRSLLPIDAVPVLAGNNGLPLREICDATGAAVELSGEGETPETLSDKICTVSGSVEQKEAASRRIVDKLRGLQEVADQEPGVFVIIVPACAAPMVVGQKGVQIKEVIELSGAEISVGKENILGMIDQPIGITGTGGQVVSAVSKINAILQDLADRGRLQPADFKWRIGQQGGLGMSTVGGAPLRGGGGPPPGDARTNAKFVVATSVAGWIIGKQGRHIRELQENSGAHIQVLKEGDVPPGVAPTERQVEVGGRFEAKAEGIQIILMAIDSMPALMAPRETLMLVPKSLATDGEVKDVQLMSGSEIEVRDLPGYDGALCTLLGTIEARVKAAQQFLKRLEEVNTQDPFAAGGNGSEPPPRREEPLLRREEPPSLRREEPPPRRDEPPPMRREEPPPLRREEPPLRREEPPLHAAASQEVVAEVKDPWNAADPWSQGKTSFAPPTRERELQTPAAAPIATPAPLAVTKSVSFSEPEVSRTPDIASARYGISTAQVHAENVDSSVEQKRLPATASGAATCVPSSCGGGHLACSGAEHAQPCSVGGPTNYSSFGSDGQNAFRPETSQQQHGGSGQISFSPDAMQPHNKFQSSFGGDGQNNFRPETTSQQHHGGSGQISFSPDAVQQSNNNFQSSSFVPGNGCPPTSSASSTSFSPMGIGGMGGMGFPGALGGVDFMGGPGMMGGPMMTGMGGAGSSANEAMFNAALMSSMASQAGSQLQLLLPSDLLQQSLVPHGHLADIAQKCQIRLDLGADVPPNMRQVSLTGSIAANAMAAYFLQERLVQYVAVGAGGCFGSSGGVSQM